MLILTIFFVFLRKEDSSIMVKKIFIFLLYYNDKDIFIFESGRKEWYMVREVVRIFFSEY